ncbi:MAG: NAD(P)H-dependent oxidoreductase [Sphingorhabdus sp.]
MRKQTRENTESEPKHAVILCHPDPESFNGAVAKTYCDAVRANFHEAIVRDLYSLKFNPVLRANEQPSALEFVPLADVAIELDMLSNADVIVLVYPIWFGTPPAMLKGYVERVLGAGFGHRLMRERGPGSVAAGKHLVSITTSGNSSQWLDSQGALVSLHNVFDNYLANAFSMASHSHLHLSGIVADMSDLSVRRELYLVSEIADATCAKLLNFKAAPLATAL